MLLAVWAASFGVNEYGIEELHHGEAVIRNRRDITNDMVQEMLYLIDVHGILRKPTWDGVRALHLLLPLTQGRSSVFPSCPHLTHAPTQRSSLQWNGSSCTRPWSARSSPFVVSHRYPLSGADKDRPLIFLSARDCSGMHISSKASPADFVVVVY